MTHHFLRAAQLTPAEILFRRRHQAARERINRAGDAYLKKLEAIAAEEAAEEAEQRRQQEAAVIENIKPVALPVQVRDQIKIIQRLTCDAFEIDMLELMSERRERRLVMARQTAMYLCKRYTSQSFPYIGKRFGRDHTTVLYGCRRVEEILSIAPSERCPGWSAADCRTIRERTAQIEKAYLDLIASEDQP